MVSIAFEKTTLSNGLDVIIHEDHSIPLVAVNVWYHVGSKDEEVGRTGFAHLFEHVMFEGSKHHNSSHFEPLQKIGANLNGSTTGDRTNYWEDVPSNYLELALWLEADRMGFLVDALDQQRFDIQRDVVKNERRQSYENRPYGMAHWHITEALYPLPHPYHWMTIGSQEDLDAASLDDVKEFFQRFYGPSNASVAIAGDIDNAEALELVNRYFGDLKPGDPVPRMYRQDSALPGRIELEMRDKVTLPRLYVAYPAPPEGRPSLPTRQQRMPNTDPSRCAEIGRLQTPPPTAMPLGALRLPRQDAVQLAPSNHRGAMTKEVSEPTIPHCSTGPRKPKPRPPVETAPEPHQEAASRHEETYEPE